MPQAKQGARGPHEETDTPVGLVPAAGRAARLPGLDGSKEVLPVPRDGALRPVAEHLLGQMGTAGVRRAFVILREDKWDVPAGLGSGDALGVRLAYLVLPDSASVVQTLDHAYPFVAGRSVALGFPDVLLEPRDALARVLAKHRAAQAEVTLGLFPNDRPTRSDMVEVDSSGRVVRVEVKPARTRSSYGWMLAVWNAAFSERLHAFAAALAQPAGAPEAYPGHVLQEALADGVRIESVSFPEGWSLDVGTPEDLERAHRARGNRPEGV